MSGIGMAYSANLISRLSGPDWFRRPAQGTAGYPPECGHQLNFNVLRYFNGAQCDLYPKSGITGCLRRE